MNIDIHIICIDNNLNLKFQKYICKFTSTENVSV